MLLPPPPPLLLTLLHLTTYSVSSRQSTHFRKRTRCPTLRLQHLHHGPRRCRRHRRRCGSTACCLSAATVVFASTQHSHRFRNSGHPYTRPPDRMGALPTRLQYSRIPASAGGVESSGLWPSRTSTVATVTGAGIPPGRNGGRRGGLVDGPVDSAQPASATKTASRPELGASVLPFTDEIAMDAIPTFDATLFRWADASDYNHPSLHSGPSRGRSRSYVYCASFPSPSECVAATIVGLCGHIPVSAAWASWVHADAGVSFPAVTQAFWLSDHGYVAAALSSHGGVAPIFTPGWRSISDRGDASLLPATYFGGHGKPYLGQQQRGVPISDAASSCHAACGPVQLDLLTRPELWIARAGQGLRCRAACVPVIVTVTTFRTVAAVYWAPPASGSSDGLDKYLSVFPHLFRPSPPFPPAVGLLKPTLGLLSPPSHPCFPSLGLSKLLSLLTVNAALDARPPDYAPRCSQDATCLRFFTEPGHAQNYLHPPHCADLGRCKIFWSAIGGDAHRAFYLHPQKCANGATCPDASEAHRRAWIHPPPQVEPTRREGE